jgi:hypothetical protein
LEEIKMRFTNEETNVLNKIATESKMDCWFCISTEDPDSDYIYDLENDKFMLIEEGVGQLVEGMTNYEDYSMTEDEIKTFEELISKLNIEFTPLD